MVHLRCGHTVDHPAEVTWGDDRDTEWVRCPVCHTWQEPVAVPREVAHAPA